MDAYRRRFIKGGLALGGFSIARHALATVGSTPGGTTAAAAASPVGTQST